MKAQLYSVLAGILLFALSGAQAATVTFNFDNGPFHGPTPFDQLAEGLNAHFEATDSGYSLQPADTLGFTPAGFSGYCIYPSSISLSDLTITFSQQLTDASILYAPQELATDSSATMRITTYLSGTLVGTATHTNPNPGTWPSDILSFSSAQPFDKIVIHYESPPVTGGDYGVIFMADNLVVNTVPEPTTAVTFGSGLIMLSVTRVRRSIRRS